MIRMLGVLAGSALAAGALLLLFGLPEFAADTRFTGNDDDAIVTLPRPDPAPEPAATAPAASTAAPVAEPVAAVAPPERPQAPPAVPARKWHAFWSPFRSEIAASGFVARLERVTGLDYRVVKVKNGVYEVAFAYADDAELAANLSQISAATGLELPDG